MRNCFLFLSIRVKYKRDLFKMYVKNQLRSTFSIGNHLQPVIVCIMDILIRLYTEHVTFKYNIQRTVVIVRNH